MSNPLSDPRTEDTLAYDVLRGPVGAPGEVIGRAIFQGGRSTVEAPADVRVAIEELLSRSFVDRVEPDEQPRGYRRSDRRSVEMLHTGMAEHFVARMRGLWLPYPDGTVVTAQVAPEATLPAATTPESTDVGPPVTDAALRRLTLETANTMINRGPLAITHPPDTGMRPRTARTGSESRTDCGWLV